MHAPRRKFFIDRPVQGLLLARVVLYWFTCLYGLFCLVALWPLLGALAEPQLRSNSWEIVGSVVQILLPGLLGGLVLLPLLLFDVTRTSHRFVGPILRVRSALLALGRGCDPGYIVLRRHDYWQDLAEAVNQLRERMLEDGTLTPTPDADSPRGAEAREPRDAVAV